MPVYLSWNRYNWSVNDFSEFYILRVLLPAWAWWSPPGWRGPPGWRRPPPGGPAPSSVAGRGSPALGTPWLGSAYVWTISRKVTPSEVQDGIRKFSNERIYNPTNQILIKKFVSPLPLPVANVTFVTALGSAGEMFSRASGPLHCHSFTYLSFFTWK